MLKINGPIGNYFVGVKYNDIEINVPFSVKPGPPTRVILPHTAPSDEYEITITQGKSFEPPLSLQLVDDLGGYCSNPPYNDDVVVKQGVTMCKFNATKPKPSGGVPFTSGPVSCPIGRYQLQFYIGVRMYAHVWIFRLFFGLL